MERRPSDVNQRVLIERIPAPLASLYEKATRLVIESYYSGVAEEIVSSFKRGTLLDLGTGPGYLPIEIVKRSPSIRCDGIDLSRRLVKMARGNARKAGVADRLNFEVGNAANLRFEDESYDMVISTGMLHMLRDPVKVLMECYRVLRPGGEAWIYDPACVSSQMDKEKWKASLNTIEKLSYVLFKLYLRISPPHTYVREQVEEMIAATEFEEYDIEEEDKEIKVRLRKCGL
jgi:ubiquinone/menaquinone biosynthesis C-methylase UbiE